MLWLSLFFLIFGAIWYYFQGEDKTENKSSSIIISQPSLDDVSENIVVENSNNLSYPKEIKEVTENLDEVISTYEASTQN
ncbi:hypothetical protein N8516_05065 [Candidatus Thioglobus sp.]|nr:hypothetical protein [Candidatus Thioglobus sp.]